MTVREAERAKLTMAQFVAALPLDERNQFLEGLSREERELLNYRWDFWARPAQLPPPGNWRTWLIQSGRGWGKTRTGVEFIRYGVEQLGCKRIALVARTAADCRDTMIEGESGILACSPPWFRPQYLPSKRRLIWPNGAIATTYSGDEPDQLRGPQHDFAWADELAAWRYPDAWDMLQFGLRLGVDPRSVVTTTPRPTKVIKELISDPTTFVTRGSTYENAGNLATSFLGKIRKKYEGTRLGRQELHGEVLDDNPNALWSRENIEKDRTISHPDLDVVVVALDPEASDGENSAETGIIVAGKARVNGEYHAFVLDDCTIQGKPDVWAKAAVTAYNVHKADRIIAEVNNGGDMVESTIRTVSSKIPYKAVHASRGKLIRAEPVSALYEQHRVHHVGVFSELEDQQCEWEPGMPSPDRIDALVWALTELMVGEEEASRKVRTW